mgnify:CR=1 FL=1
MRLLLAVMVVAVHTPHYPDRWPNLGAVAVSVFFFISGFLMPLAFEANYKFERFSTKAMHFWINRFLRIYPWYWLSILLPLAYVFVRGPQNETQQHYFDTGVILQNALLLGLNQDGAWGRYIRYNNPAWTLDIELQYYLLVPLLVWGYDRLPKIITGSLMLCSIASIYLLAFPSGRNDIDWSLLGFSALFFAGFFIFQMQKTGLNCNDEKWTMVGAALIFISILMPDPFRVPGLCIGLILVCVYLLGAELLQSQDATDKFIGDLSYPVYIFHFFLIGITQGRTEAYLQSLQFSGFGLFLGIFVTNIIVCVSVCSILVAFGEPVIGKIRSRIKRNQTIFGN